MEVGSIQPRHHNKSETLLLSQSPSGENKKASPLRIEHERNQNKFSSRRTYIVSIDFSIFLIQSSMVRQLLRV